MHTKTKIIQKDLAIYGIGSAFHWFHEIFIISGKYIPKRLFDKNLDRRQIVFGIPASPDPRDIPHEFRKSYLVIVCVGNSKIYEEIKFDLTSIGFENILWIHELYEIHDPFNMSQTSLKNLTFSTEDSRRIRSLLADLKSQEVYDAFTQTHLTKVPVQIPASPASEQYFPTNFINIKDLDEVVFCGGDIDDLIRLSRHSNKPLREVTVIEPDPINLRSLQKPKIGILEYELIKRNINNLKTLSLAVGSKAEYRSFLNAEQRGSSTSFGSRIHPEGKMQVQVVRLDDLFADRHPDYICMDIEGNEMEAIRGAENIIRESKTDLAISVYHDVAHCREIVDFIVARSPKFRFFLRNYTGFSMETILYATSPGRHT
jgi:FkbM family methyltransferase